jgi:hypothetical protein
LSVGGYRYDCLNIADRLRHLQSMFSAAATCQEADESVAV